MNGKYILDAHGEPVPEPNLYRWGRWLQTADRRLAEDNIGAMRISTIFLGLDHRFNDRTSPPILWETMVFGGPLHGEQARYASRAEALAGHAALVARAKAMQP